MAAPDPRRKPERRNAIELEYRRTWLKGLMIDCPYGKPLDECPAKSIRQLPIKERIAFVDAMDEHAVDEVLAHHKRCLHQRETA
jgi:hypothetical protein